MALTRAEMDELDALLDKESSGLTPEEDARLAELSHQMLHATHPEFSRLLETLAECGPIEEAEVEG